MFETILVCSLGAVSFVLLILYAGAANEIMHLRAKVEISDMIRERRMLMLKDAVKEALRGYLELAKGQEYLTTLAESDVRSIGIWFGEGPTTAWVQEGKSDVEC